MSSEKPRKALTRQDIARRLGITAVIVLLSALAALKLYRDAERYAARGEYRKAIRSFPFKRAYYRTTSEGRPDVVRVE